MMDKINGKNLLAVDQAASKKPGKAIGGAQEDSFALDLAGAQSVAAQNPQSNATQPVAQPAAPAVPSGNSMDGVIAQGAMAQPGGMDMSRIGPRASALGSMERPGTGAERSPLTLASAVSMNTAAAIAGPKPWGREWVFEGLNRNPDIQPLFEAAPKAVDLNEVLKGGDVADALSQTKAGGAEGAQAIDPSAVSARRVALEADAADAQDQAEGSDFGDLGALNELIQAASSDAHTGKAAVMAKAVRTNGPVANASLSGSEYLSTLAALKGGQSGEKAGSQTGGESAEGQGQSLNAKAGLKVIEGGFKNRKSVSEFEELSVRAGGAQAGDHVGANKVGVDMKAMQEVTGHVVKGAMSQDRLSSESLNGISSGIRTLSPNGGGEMKIRLNPDNLGELHVRVVTQGNQVGLQIQASDERARKILEESMSSLKTSLAAQHLTLNQIDLTVGQSQQASSGDSQGQPQAQSQQQFGDLLGGQRGFDRNGSGSDRWSGSEDRMAANAGIRGATSALNTSARASSAASASRAYAQAGRLDVRV